MAFSDRRSESAVVDALTLSPLPYPVLFLLLMVALLLGASWRFAYEDFMEEAQERLSWALLAVPLLLLLLIRWVSSSEAPGALLGFLAPGADRRLPWRGGGEAPPREGGSPWGVAAAVVLLLVLASFHSTFRDIWGP